MEDVDVKPPLPGLDAVSGRRVFVTGHTGFKGAWLVEWLLGLGCSVTGYALEPATKPSLFELLDIAPRLSAHHLGDVADRSALTEALARSQPDLVVHMAAQPIVLSGYRDPAPTWLTNVMGTVNVLEAVRVTGSVRATLVVTTDKVYRDTGARRDYREDDELGGADPYSASKAAAELVVRSYAASFFSTAERRIATARSGNVIGGGDWSADRLLADAARAVAAGDRLIVRNPGAIRPWQHILDCLAGYIALAGFMLDGRPGPTAYNFGPPPEAGRCTVESLLSRLSAQWPGLRWQVEPDPSNPHEAAVLALDSSLAIRELGWRPRWSLDRTLAATAEWYRRVEADPDEARRITRAQIAEYSAG